ncbi:MAG: hypothetical protein AAF687_12595 [Pseudomonadota bacterium]
MKNAITLSSLTTVAALAFCAVPVSADEPATEEPETKIHVEEYPNGTVWVNQDDGRYLWPAGKNERIDCNDNMKECKKHLADAVDSGEPIVTDMAGDISPSQLSKVLRKRPAVLRFLTSRVNKARRSPR